MHAAFKTNAISSLLPGLYFISVSMAAKGRETTFFLTVCLEYFFRNTVGNFSL